MAENNQEVKFEIINQIGVVSTASSGWNLELNRVSWNGRKPKYDLRPWAPDHSKMGKGLTLTDEELKTLAALLEKEAAYLNEN